MRTFPGRIGRRKTRLDKMTRGRSHESSRRYRERRRLPVARITDATCARATLIESSVALERGHGRAAEENTRYTNKTDTPRRKFGDPRNETLGNHLWHGISKRVLILPTTGGPARPVASRRVGRPAGTRHRISASRIGSKLNRKLLFASSRFTLTA